jgi:fatty-acyl-CoA synthase
VVELDRSAGANVASWLEVRGRAHPQRVALITEPGGERVGYGELLALAERCAARLFALGVRAGDRVALAFGSEPLYLALYFAVARLGAILVPLNTRLTAPELAFQIRDAEPQVLIKSGRSAAPGSGAPHVLAREEFLAQLEQSPEPPPIAPGGEAAHVLMYTSGTTGEPKGALLPHRKTVFNTLNAELYFELRAGDVIAAPVPLFHSFGLKILSVPALFTGATVVLIDRFDPSEVQEIAARHGATLLAGVPIMHQRMLRAGIDAEKLRSLRLAFSAGASLDPETIRAFGALGIPLVQGYGQTETSILTCLDRANALRKAGSVGRRVRYAELRIADADGRALGPGVEGEVQARGEILMQGFWRRPDATAASRTGDGWHRTGDLGRLDDEGFLTLVGRRGDMYISGGENVYPAEVERVLEQHPEIAEAAVVGVPDAEWGEVGRAYVVARGARLDVDALLSWTRERLAGYKRPRQVRVVAELPRTASGKVQKHRLLDDDRDAEG